MTAQIARAVTPKTDRSAYPGISYRQVPLRLRSRLVLLLMRLIMKPLVGFVFRSGRNRMARFQMQVASMRCPDASGMKIAYRMFGKEPGHQFGDLSDTTRPVLLWLHGGGFVLPAAPTQHHVMVAKLCRDLGACGFMPDYRLAPFHPYPAALDDCELAYRTLLERGFASGKIIVGGDSAGGNLVLGLLQRIRGAGLPMPACAIPVSPVTDLCRGHGAQSRHMGRRDPLLPISAMARLADAYMHGRNARDPELSPLYMDCDQLPPLFFLASDSEILSDDTVLLVERMREAGAPVRCDIWPHFPHAFPLFENLFPEVRQARLEIVEFVRQHVT